ncbi:alpha/beta fold hydrolase [Cellulomonas fengjieae]|uniref:Alpha/beta hydrolase n=1 Tax=Cellulomonas fengjieae TaxID=2819978 RepID=A0ABS3SJW7_9CELL|nr:alpha/beta hydrolase [Cellulomonas fengjieae]MBO3086041.1 alpha/beta hydrolase [Cellulomonas fengjieae]MBO3103991.1 alpha/beta hydrolase [Cellulomonas fengjieae]QVI65890.1 alpha/beta hydrolase [Cellulomonas fengjieae]
MTTLTTATTLDVPGARLHYELRGSGPLVALVGAPMDATAFAPLADLLASDHTVLTTDPRGINRSTVDHPDRDSTPVERASDLAALLRHADRGPAAVLGSSGGAVAVLALVEAHPDLVHTAIAHEPPLDELVPDHADLYERTERMIATYLSGDTRAAWRQFMEIGNIHMPEEAFEMFFGTPREGQDGADEHFQFVHMIRDTVRFRPDVAALTAAPTRIVVGIGEESTGQLCDRTSRALASLLGIEPVLFPGDHIGFAEQPEEFVVRLREVL